MSDFMNLIGGEAASVLGVFGTLIKTSRNFTVLKSGMYSILAHGGGGSGASNDNASGAGGGKAGEFVQAVVSLKAGEIYQILIGAGGVQTSIITGENGFKGSSTSFGSLVIAEGGLGGLLNDPTIEETIMLNGTIAVQGFNSSYGGVSGGQPSILTVGGAPVVGQSTQPPPAFYGAGGGGVSDYAIGSSVPSGKGGDGFMIITFLGK